MPRKMRFLGLGSALQNAAENGSVFVVPSLHDYKATIKTRVRDNVKEDVSKGQDLVQLLRKWGLPDYVEDDNVRQSRCHIIVNALPPHLYMSSIHLDHVAVDDVRSIKVQNILKANTIFIDAPAFKYIQRVFKADGYKPFFKTIEGNGLKPITADFVPYDAAEAEEFATMDPNQKWPHGVDVDMVLGKKEVPRHRGYTGFYKRDGQTEEMVERARLVKLAMQDQQGTKGDDEAEDDGAFKRTDGGGEIDPTGEAFQEEQ